MGGSRCQGDWQLVRPNTVRLPCRTYSKASLPTRPTEAVGTTAGVFRRRGTTDDTAELGRLRVLMDMRLNPIHHPIQAFAGHEVREDERSVASHPATIPVHDAEIGTDVWSKVDFIDHK